MNGDVHDEGTGEVRCRSGGVSVPDGNIPQEMPNRYSAPMASQKYETNQ